MKKLFLFSSLLFGVVIMAQSSNLKLPSIISDNMVLQQTSTVPFWGKGIPGEEIKISTGWNENASGVCAEDSTWKININTPKAGGPYDIVINHSGSEVKLQNILIGEVWLCSGQSNMEMPLGGWPPNDLIEGYEEAINTANYPDVRLFTVARNVSMIPNDNCIGEWNVCSPTTVFSFSATAFFFGRKLYNELNIPIGLIHSSWGGTPAEAWTDKEHLSGMEEFMSTLKAIDESLPAMEKLKQWLNKYPVINMSSLGGKDMWKNLDFNDAECAEANYDNSKWMTIQLPTLWEQTNVGELDGVIWFRKKVEIPDTWLNKDLVISLGPIDDYDRTYINGKMVGAIEEDGNYQTDRIYDIPASLNASKEISIAVRVMDNRGGGGIYGKPEKMKLILKSTDESVPISGEWKYLPVAEFRGNIFYVFGAKDETYKKRPVLPIELNSWTPSALFNAMIAPLVPFGIKGAIWYQGEANSGRPEQYEILFPTMIKGWRDKWGYKFPFYFVQIAPYNYGEDTPSEYLRDAQRKTLSLENTGMAVTLDIGNNANIHPANKKDVGERLALWALAKDYGKEIVYSGPLYKSMKVNGNKIELFFDNIGGGLILKNNNGKTEFLIAGKDKVFKPAQVEVNGNELVVYSNEVSEPAAVRYSWGNTTGATLFNKEGLPASSFRTDNWKR